jgi:4-hydroxy-2-oxoheptanedioate aldolase
MKPNRLKQRMLANDPTLLNGWLTLGSIASAEIMAHQPWDSLTIDMQHGLSDDETSINMLRAISTTDVTPMVRVPWLDPALIMRMLDAGAYGIICPMVNTRAQCEEFVSCCRSDPRAFVCGR